jgi:hypothetical protein
MQNKALIIGLSVLAALGMSSTASAIGSAAQPMLHEYYGTSLDNVYVNLDEPTPLGEIQAEAASSVSVVGVCADISPLFNGVPNIGLDGVAETGVGGGCFAFTTVYGSDVGTTQRVSVSEAALTEIHPVVYQVCVDENGDGLCSAATGDEVALCEATSGHGFFLGTTTPCTIYLDPLAANQAVFVQIIGEVLVDGSVTAHAGLHGFIYYE